MAKSNEHDYILTKIGIHTILIIISISCIFPLLWMVSSSFKTQDTIFQDMNLWPSAINVQVNNLIHSIKDEPNKFFEHSINSISNIFKNYIEAWKGGKFGTYFINSLLYTSTIIFGLVIIASLAAFAFSKLEFPGRNVLFYVFIGVMMIPIPGAFVAIFVILNKLGLVNTRIGYILPQINYDLPFAIYMLKTFFDKMPKEVEDSAKIDGCNKLQIYWHVALPLAKTALAVIIIFNALATWNEYLLAKLILSTSDLMPLQVGLLAFQGERITEYPQLMAGMTITMLPIIIFYLCMQKNIIKGIMAGAIKG